MSRSMNHVCIMLSSSKHLPFTTSDLFICSHTSFLISSALHSFAGLPYKTPGSSQSETSHDKTDFVLPSAKLLIGKPFQNCSCDIAVIAHGLSAKMIWPLFRSTAS